MNRRPLILALLACAIACAGCRQDDHGPPTSVGITLNELQQIEQKHAARRQEWLEAMSGTTSDEERVNISRVFQDYLLRAINAMLDIAERQPSSPVGKHAAIWVVSSCDSDYEPHRRAADLLLQHHSQADELRAVCQHLGGFSPVYEQLLRAATSSKASAEARANANFHLAELLVRRSDFRASIDSSPELSEQRERNMGPDVEAFLAAIDRSHDREEAIALYQTVQLHFTNVPYRNSTLGEAATERLMLLQQTHPELGKAAPDIVAQNLNGNRVALSGYRGKVVVLTFWASWCGACLDRIPEENRLANELRESPFAFLGVNGDQAIDDARKAVAKHGIDFDSWWDDPNVEPTIVSRWGVTYWPTTFVLDKSGVIRNKDLAGPELRAAIVELLNERSESVPKPK